MIKASHLLSKIAILSILRELAAAGEQQTLRASGGSVKGRWDLTHQSQSLNETKWIKPLVSYKT